MKKSINFDLDTNKLKEHYPNKNYTNAYENIRKFLSENGFEHRQGSGYISKENMSNVDVVEIIAKLDYKHPWLQTCCRTLDYYDVGKEHNGLEALTNIKKDKTIKVDKFKEKDLKPKLISNYIPKNKTKNKDMER